MRASTHSLLWEPYIEAARESWWNGDYEKTANILILALKESEDHGTIDPCLIRSVENLAQMFLRQREYSKAEWLQMQAFEVQEKLLGPDHPEVARSFDKLAVIIEEWENCEPNVDVRPATNDRDDWTILVVEEEPAVQTSPPPVRLPSRAAWLRWGSIAGSG